MSEQAAPEKIFSGINIPKVLAGALAAITVAVLGSFLGVAGTLAGAAIASVVGSVGTEIYERSLKHGAKKLQTVVSPTFVKAPAAVGTPQVAAATEDDSPSHVVPEEERKKQIRWGRVAAAAAAVFLIAMGGITAFELISGETVAGAVGATSDTSGTSLFGNTSKSSDDTPATTPSSTPSEAPTSDPATTPTSSAPSSAASTDSGSTGATTAPATDTPTTDPGTDSGSTDGATNDGTTGDGAAVNPDSGQGTQGSGQ